jgi:hypothetical protein
MRYIAYAAIVLAGIVGGPAWAADTIGTAVALNALNATALVAMADHGGAGVHIAAGTLAGTLVPEVSYDGGTAYVASRGFRNPADGTNSATLVLTNPSPAIDRSIIVEGGATNVRVRVSAFTSGTATATLRSTVVATNGATSGAYTPIYPADFATPISTFTTGYGFEAITSDPCEIVAKVFTPISITSATTQKISGVISKKKYICGGVLFSAIANNVAIVEGTGTNCGTGTVGVMGGNSTTNGFQLTANQGFLIPGEGRHSIAATATAADDLCFTASTAGPVSGVVVTVDK